MQSGRHSCSATSTKNMNMTISQSENIAKLAKNALKISCAWLAVFTITYAVLEISFFCCSSYLFPYAARLSAGFGIYPLLQTSKSSVSPEDYTAIFGDSYGFGDGDYFFYAQHEINPKFNATHFLKDRTGKDFISFAIPGSSNLTGWIEDPISSLNYINSTALYKLNKPRSILLYFYEGNDVQDTKIDMQDRYIKNGYELGMIKNKEYFLNFVKKEMLDKNKINIKSKSITIKDNLFFKEYVINSIKKSMEFEEINSALESIKIEKISGIEIKSNPEIEKTKDLIKNITAKKISVNRAEINGKAVYFPDNLPAPPVGVTDEEINETIMFLDAIANYVKSEYAGSRIAIIYIPSTATSYKLLSDTINAYNPGGDNLYKTDDIYKKSNIICNKLRSISIENGIDFYDTRQGIARAGMKEMLHGPLDMGHFNLQGYKALSNEIYNFIMLQEKNSPEKFIASCVNLPL
jgi:hypothetical protein